MRPIGKAVDIFRKKEEESERNVRSGGGWVKKLPSLNRLSHLKLMVLGFCGSSPVVNCFF